ncbi:MAG: hypothetical protein A2X55_04715 [Nitrospirae bacterium GWB2_47_37]|nr:MAG: hypothetical protein A2X55_04715 [Nitrospirae bacterium GWB2_47_37]HAK89656.1 formyl transferase [Nitrospiraceae bacterium]
MRVLFLGGNPAKDIADWLEEQGEVVVYTEDKLIIDEARHIKPDMIVSYNYKYIIPKVIIDCVKGKTVNLHISYLPFNRGAHPNIWSFIEDTPKGVTIHYIDEGIDTGAIIVQKEVFIDEEKETIASSYEILHKEIQSLFKENWNKIKNGEIALKKQTGEGSLHYKKDSIRFEHLLKEKGWGIPIKELKLQYGQIKAKRYEQQY